MSHGVRQYPFRYSRWRVRLPYPHSKSGIVFAWHPSFEKPTHHHHSIHHHSAFLLLSTSLYVAWHSLQQTMVSIFILSLPFIPWRWGLLIHKMMGTDTWQIQIKVIKETWNADGDGRCSQPKGRKQKEHLSNWRPVKKYTCLTVSAAIEHPECL